MSQSPSDREAASASLASHWLARPVVWLGGAVSALLILATFAVTIHAIFMRYVMNKPLLWADEVTGWALVAIVMLGAAEAYRRGDHIAIDLLSSRASGAWSSAIAFIADLAVLGFAGIVGFSTWESIGFARAFGSYTAGHIVIETWILQSPILIGCVLLGLMAAVRLAERISGHRRA